jgi:hypothetical protein
MTFDEKRAQPGDRLDGWKEISNYLRCDVRTCLRWEKHGGLPVSRIGNNGKRSKVIAFKADLDQWLVRKRTQASPAPGRKNIGGIILLAALPVLIVLVFVVPRLFFNSGDPIRMELNGQALVAFDAKNVPLWSIPIKAAGDQTYFYIDSPNPYGLKRSRFAFSDIDGDGRNEVAVFLNAENPASRAVALYDHNKHQLWERKVQLAAIYPEGPPGNNFVPVQIAIKDVLGDARPEILALWRHSRFHPGIFEIYSVDGALLFHYEHTGILQSFVLQFDGNGEHVREILLGGTNNLLNGDAVLAVLDPADLRSGLGPPYAIPSEFEERQTELKRYLPLNAQPASYKHYFRFPHNDFATNKAIHYMNVLEILPSEQGYSVQVQYGGSETAYYKFDSDFRLLGVQAGTHLMKAYDDLLQRGIVHKPLEQFLAERSKDIWRWNGAGWEKAFPDSR